MPILPIPRHTKNPYWSYNLRIGYNAQNPFVLSCPLGFCLPYGVTDRTRKRLMHVFRSMLFPVEHVQTITCRESHKCDKYLFVLFSSKVLFTLGSFGNICLTFQVHIKLAPDENFGKYHRLTAIISNTPGVIISVSGWASRSAKASAIARARASVKCPKSTIRRTPISMNDFGQCHQ